MSATDEEVSIAERVAERPKLEPGKIRKARPRDLAIRFVAGAATSIARRRDTRVRGGDGRHPTGVPGILAASLTLIEEQEDRTEAREDARGAVIGGCALTLFAAVAAITLGHLSPVIAFAARIRHLAGGRNPRVRDRMVQVARRRSSRQRVRRVRPASRIWLPGAVGEARPAVGVDDATRR